MAFYYCNKLEEVINNSNLHLKPGSDSHGMVAKYAIKVNNGNEEIFVIDNYHFSYQNGIYQLIDYTGHDDIMILPSLDNGQTYIIVDKFIYGRNDLTPSKIIIPSCVSSIGNHAFCYFSSNFTCQIIINVGVSEIEGCAFLSNDIYFTGTEEEWNKINVSDGSYYTLHYNYVP